MVARYDRTIVNWKGVLKNSFYVMESRVSSNYTRNIHRPSTPQKEVNRKENTVGKIVTRRLIRKSTHAQIPILVKFYSIAKGFSKNRIGIFRVRFIEFPSEWNFPKICWIVKHICAPFLSPCWWKKFKDQIWDRERKHKIANSEETAFITPFLSAILRF